MASAQIGAVVRQMSRLFGGEGTVAGLDEAGLLRRFVIRRDSAALEALVARHGPMVLGVCRRILGDSHDAEDAFQATFLVLVKKAAAIRDPNLLGPWLHGVAHRVAVRARANAAIRWSREGSGLQEAAMVGLGVGDSLDRAELRAALDDEVARLPERFRRVVVLCYLDGLTHEQAAERLRCPVGTVRSRLAASREKLRGRLARRGVMASTATFAVALAAETAKASVPLALSESTLSAGMAFFSSGAATAGMVSAGAASLADGVMTTMFLTKIKILGGLALAGVLTLGVGGAAAMQLGVGQGAKPGATAARGSDDTLESLIAKMRKQADVSELEKKELETALERARRDADRLRDEIAALKDQLNDLARSTPKGVVDEAERELVRRQTDFDVARAKSDNLARRIPTENDSIRRLAKQEMSVAEEKLQIAKAILSVVRQAASVAEDKAQPATRKSSFQRGSGMMGSFGTTASSTMSGKARGAGAAGGMGTTSPAVPVTPGSSYTAGMRGQPGMMGGGMASMMGATGLRNQAGISMVSAGDYVLIQKPDSNEILASNPETGRNVTYTAPEGTSVLPLVGFNLVAMNVTGKPIKQLAVFLPTEGNWHTVDLDTPAEGPVSPLVAPGIVIYTVGHRVYAFSARAKAWGVATLEDGANAVPIVQGNQVTIEENGKLHVFNPRTAKWTDHEAGVLVERKGKLYVFSTKTSKWTDLDEGVPKIEPQTR